MGQLECWEAGFIQAPARRSGDWPGAPAQDLRGTGAFEEVTTGTVTETCPLAPAGWLSGPALG